MFIRLWCFVNCLEWLDCHIHKNDSTKTTVAMSGKVDGKQDVSEADKRILILPTGTSSKKVSYPLLSCKMQVPTTLHWGVAQKAAAVSGAVVGESNHSNVKKHFYTLVGKISYFNWPIILFNAQGTFQSFRNNNSKSSIWFWQLESYHQISWTHHFTRIPNFWESAPQKRT